MTLVIYTLCTIYFIMGLLVSYWHTTKLLKQDDKISTHTTMDDIKIILFWPSKYKKIKRMS